ncbi:MAG: hypothetical protein IJH63_00565 [Methanobrevibacter sp.]|nr:hypothetical protein [Methanosphaera sp.]MBR0369196.1 hypothetical protein [Methanobrevibacter sp.]
MELEEICKEYFNDVKPKHMRRFNETTPEGNNITGYICHKPNKYLGSMLIMTVNGEETNQFIQSMPKIHYFEDSRDISEHSLSLCYEKLDGTCLIIYPLKNSKGETIEVVPKTRGRPVADKHFRELLQHVDQKPIQKYYKKNDGILIFEMYGILNQHEIIHYDTGIDIRLIAEYNDGVFEINPVTASIWGFRKPDLLFTLFKHGTDWMVKTKSKKFQVYLGNEIYTFPTNIDAVDGIQNLLEDLNKQYIEVNGIRAIEGVVINTRNINDHPKWLKCKPRDIENEHRTVNGIPRSSITKEVLKYFDEYGSEVKEIYLKDKNHHTEYIHRMLSEEYNADLIKKSKNKIERVFIQIADSKTVPESIHKICEDLLDEYGDEGIRKCMQEFAKEYPFKKKEARMVYNTLEMKFKKKGLDLKGKN